MHKLPACQPHYSALAKSLELFGPLSSKLNSTKTANLSNNSQRVEKGKRKKQFNERNKKVELIRRDFLNINLFVSFYSVQKLRTAQLGGFKLRNNWATFLPYSKLHCQSSDLDPIELFLNHVQTTHIVIQYPNSVII